MSATSSSGSETDLRLVRCQDQAIDRAHRFGQKHAVQVYKIMIQDTIEENILILQ